MKVLATEIPGVLIIEPRVFGDERGFFFESFNLQRWREQTGLDTEFVANPDALLDLRRPEYALLRNARARLTGDHFIFDPRRDEVLAEVPCLHLERVAVFGNVQFSTQSLVELLDHVVLAPSRVMPLG